MMTMKPVTLFVALLLPVASRAFSSWAAPDPYSRVSPADTGIVPSSVTATTDTPASWRIVLDIGREPLSSMPFDWARSGCRMPLVIPCDFNSNGVLVPRSETVSFTGPDGAVVSPIEGGEWQVTNDKNLQFTLKFPQSMARRDVSIDAGTIMKLEGTVYTKSEVDRLNEEFYKAREKAWELGKQLNDMARRQDAPKKWNEETQRWEKRFAGESIASQLALRASHLKAQSFQQQKNNQRPDIKTLSDRGLLPGLGSDGFVEKQGIVKVGNKNAWTGRGESVIGTWSAEPINDKPVSYRN